MQFEHFLKIHSQSKMVMIYKMYNNFFLFHLQSQCLYKKQPGKHHTGRRNHQIKANCVALSWADHYFPSGMKKATVAKSDFTGQDILTGHCFSQQPSSACAWLLQFKTLSFPFLPVPTSWNKSSVSFWSLDSHSLCQETCESDAFIFEGMCLCRKPTPIRVTLTQVYSNVLMLRGGVVLVEGLSRLHRQGVKISVLPVPWFYNFPQSQSRSLSLSFFFCKMAIISTTLPWWLNKITYAKHLTHSKHYYYYLRYFI